MDKRVVLAVAGSGKTKLIIDSLTLDKNALVITYTVDNRRNLEHRINEKFGCIPSNITLLTYFSFLYSFCFLPFFWLRTRPKGICWETASIRNTNPDTKSLAHYFTKKRDIYHNRIAKLILVANQEHLVQQRVQKYFDEIFVDEIQDFGSYDFDLLEEICKCDLTITLVGDFYQHTFTTSRDGRYKRNIHRDYGTYLSVFKSMGIEVDTTSLSKSYRCRTEVCNFISVRLGIDIESHRNDHVNIHIIDDLEDTLAIALDDGIIKLFYQNASKYRCRSKNWGKSKGEDNYEDVCIVLNGSTERAFKKTGQMQLAPTTRNKLYVACTRARGSIFFISESLIKTLREP